MGSLLKGKSYVFCVWVEVIRCDCWVFMQRGSVEFSQMNGNSEGEGCSQIREEEGVPLLPIWFKSLQ